MAKKSRRSRRKQRTRAQRVPSPPKAPQATQPRAATSSNDHHVAVAPPQPKLVDFSAEYHYVISDLRNMAIIAVAMLAVLIALSFVIR